MKFRTSLEEIKPEQREKIHKRIEARKNKDWGTADRIRQELLKDGIILGDTNDGGIKIYFTDS